VYTVTVELRDEHGAADVRTSTAVVTGVGVNDGVLYVIGTNADDHVTINATGKSSYRVHASFLPDRGHWRDVSAADVRRIAIILCNGDDHATVAGSIRTTVVIDGGAGNDHLNGGGGSNLIWGGPGNDRLIGGPARDILIGGAGADRLVANGGEDMLLAGSTIYDPGHDHLSQDFAEALLAVLAEWQRTDLTAAARKANIERGVGPGGAVRLDRSTLLNDSDADTLTGASVDDWFLADASRDSATDLHALDEVFTDLDGFPFDLN
jgi:Ca2+-binding RTX toxin-like protein